MKNFLYNFLKTLNDLNAVQKGKVPRRIARRTAGKLTGRAFRRIFR